jgi:non-ribosomal peptide synthetase component E (peptide arylation enzyme)
MMANMILTLLSTDRIEQHTAAGHWRDRTIYMEAAGHAQQPPDKFAARDQTRRLTYRELIGAADHLAPKWRLTASASASVSPSGCRAA